MSFWLRKTPYVTILLMNRWSPCHWLSIEATVDSELRRVDSVASFGRP